MKVWGSSIVVCFTGDTASSIKPLVTLFLQADAIFLRHPIGEHKTDIVAGFLVFFTRIAEPDQQLHSNSVVICNIPGRLFLDGLFFIFFRLSLSFMTDHGENGIVDIMWDFNTFGRNDLGNVNNIADLQAFTSISIGCGTAFGRQITSIS